MREALGQFCGVLLTDGYTVYERYAQTVNGLVHAQCWSHARRRFVDAAGVEPTLVAQALDFIGQLYHQDAQARARQLADEALLTFRAEHARPLVDAFFAWLGRTLREQVLLPSLNNSYTKKRWPGVFLSLNGTMTAKTVSPTRPPSARMRKCNAPRLSRHFLWW